MLASADDDRAASYFDARAPGSAGIAFSTMPQVVTTAMTTPTTTNARTPTTPASITFVSSVGWVTAAI
jgi:hypothetical protein